MLYFEVAEISNGTKTDPFMERVPSYLKIGDVSQVIPIPSLVRCVHMCLWYLREECIGLSYDNILQTCSISNTANLIQTNGDVITYLLRTATEEITTTSVKQVTFIGGKI